MGKKLSKGEKLDLILAELSKIRGAPEALGKQQAALVAKSGKRARRSGSTSRRARAAAA